MLQDEFAVTDFMAIELKARLTCEQRFQNRLALCKLKARDVPTVQMRKIESVIDELDVAFAVGCRLGAGEHRQPSLIDAAEFPVDVSGLNVQVCQRCDRAWIFVGPIQAGPSEQLHAPVVDTYRRAIAVQFDFVQPLSP